MAFISCTRCMPKFCVKKVFKRILGEVQLRIWLWIEIILTKLHLYAYIQSLFIILSSPSIAHVGSCQGSLRFGISTFHNFLIWRIKYLGWVVRININNQNWNVRILVNSPSCGDEITTFYNIVSSYHNGSRLLQVSTYSNLPPRGPLHPIKYLIVWLYLQPMASG